MLTRDDILKVLTILGDAYPNWARNSSKTLPDTWLALLGDLPLDRLVMAATAHAQSCTFPPTIAELRARADPSPTNAPEVAWDMCKRGALHAGPFSNDESRKQVLDAIGGKDPAALDALNAMGGMALFWGQATEDVPTNRAHFARAYLAASARRKMANEEGRAIETLTRIGGQLGSGSTEPRPLLGNQEVIVNARAGQSEG